MYDKGVGAFMPSVVKLATVIVILCSVIAVSPGSVLADETSSHDEGIGIKIASWAATVPYCLAKSTFAALGGIVGGFAFVFSGGNAETAKAVWTTSIFGTYIIRPVHLRGQESVHFLGQADEDQKAPGTPATSDHPVQTPREPVIPIPGGY